jgi:hypothetical protein
VELKTRNYVLYIPVCYVDKINFIKTGRGGGRRTWNCAIYCIWGRIGKRAKG